jgi:hypothetical protein
MPILLANWRLVLVAALAVAVLIEEIRIRSIKADFSAYKVEIERQVAQNRLKNALEQARIERNGKEALDALTNRYAALNARYRVLRQSSSAPRVPSAVEALGIVQSCPGKPDQPNPAVGQVERLERGVEEILEFGDREIAKYVELWKLQNQNATVP